MNYLSPCWTRERLDAWHSVTRAATIGQHGTHYARQAIREAFGEMPSAIQDWSRVTFAEGMLGMCAESAHVLPVLSEEGCRVILERSSAWEFTPNSNEAPEHQIAEAALAEVDPSYHQEIQSVLVEGLAPWLLMRWGRLPSTISSIQVAHYNPSATVETSYHIDRDSNFTAVIALNNDFTGGGTAMADGLFGDYFVPPVPVGHALIFDGRRISHRGMPTVGNRKLLVVWSNDNLDIW